MRPERGREATTNTRIHNYGGFQVNVGNLMLQGIPHHAVLQKWGALLGPQKAQLNSNVDIFVYIVVIRLFTFIYCSINHHHFLFTVRNEMKQKYKNSLNKPVFLFD